MNEKFKEIPVELETKILANVECKLGDYEVVYQKWYWSGIKAESIIFFNDDVANLSEDQIKKEVMESPLVNEESQLTFKKSDKYTFVNFNFVTE